MADTSKKVSELETASQVDSTDLVMLSQGSSQSGFASVKATILAIAQKIITGINFTSDLQTNNKTITGAINEVAQGGGGSSTFAGLSDVDIDDTTLANGQVPIWDGTEEKWKNGNGGGGTTVIANPTGTPTDELLTIQIGSDIYSLPEGESEHLLNDILTGPDATKATASSTSQDGAIWKAFDGVKTGTEQSCWIPEYGSTNCWICYHFATPKYITKCHVYFYENMSSTYTGSVKIQGSNDGTNWTDISQPLSLSMNRGIHDYEIESTDIVNGYSYVRMFSETALVVYGNASACTLELEIYGRDNASGGGGHTILDDSGTSLAQEDDLQFKGTYSHDDSTNGKTVVEITREMTQAQYDLLSADEKKGIIRITDDDYVCEGTEVKYAEGVSVNDKIDSMVEVLTLTAGSYISNVNNVRACVTNNKTLVISGVAYLTQNIASQVDLIDLGKNFGSNEYFGYLYSLADGFVPIKVTGTKLKSNVAISNSGNLYMDIVIVLA